MWVLSQHLCECVWSVILTEFPWVPFRRSCWPSSSAARVAWIHRAADCGGDSRSTSKKYWSLTLTAGTGGQGASSDTVTQICTHATEPHYHKLDRVHIRITETICLKTTTGPTKSTMAVWWWSSFLILGVRPRRRYKSSQKEATWSNLKKPVYLSNRGGKFSDWAATWAAYLISKVRPLVRTRNKQ